MLGRISILVALFLPLTALAQSVSFPAAPLWASDTAPITGTSIHLYTVVYNDAPTELSGSLRFLVDGAQLSEQDISLAGDSSKIITTDWKAVSGSHTFIARFIPLSETENPADTAAITVTSVEPPSPIAQAVSDAKNTATEVINSSSPIVQEVAQSIFAKSEAIREAGVDYFKSKIDPSTGNALGSSTSTKSNVEGFTNAKATTGSQSALHKATQVAAAAALFTFQNRWIYYALVVLTFYLIIRFAIGWVNRPRF